MVTNNRFTCVKDILNNGKQVFTKDKEYSVMREGIITVMINNDLDLEAAMTRSEFCSYFRRVQTT